MTARQHIIELNDAWSDLERAKRALEWETKSREDVRQELFDKHRDVVRAQEKLASAEAQVKRLERLCGVTP
jgi:uncharacterized protein (DUF3084 family)